MKVCVYTICKNEIQNIDKWYQSASEADYICVLDTGSTDGTYEYLQKLEKITVKQQIFQPFDFGAAKTSALSLVPLDTDVCVTFDFDEALSPGWYSNFCQNQEILKRPSKVLYFSLFNSSNTLEKFHLRLKYFSHPYSSSIFWKFSVFEEPWYMSSSKIEKSLWNWFDIPYNVFQNIILYHNKNNYPRNYSPLIKEKIYQGFREAKACNDLGKLHHIMLSLLEAFIIENDNFSSLIDQLLSILIKRSSFLNLSPDEKLQNIYLKMTYFSKLQRIDEAYQQSLNLNKLIPSIHSEKELFPVLDSLRNYLCTFNISEFLEVFKKILRYFNNINSPLLVSQFQEVCFRLLNFKDFSINSIQDFATGGLKKSCESIQSFLNTKIFESFSLKDIVNLL